MELFENKTFKKYQNKISEYLLDELTSKGKKDNLERRYAQNDQIKKVQSAIRYF